MLTEIEDALGLVNKKFPQLVARRILARSDQDLAHAEDLGAKKPQRVDPEPPSSVQGSESTELTTRLHCRDM